MTADPFRHEKAALRLAGPLVWVAVGLGVILVLVFLAALGLTASGAVTNRAGYTFAAVSTAILGGASALIAITAFLVMVAGRLRDWLGR